MIYTVTLNPALDHELTVPELVENEPLRATASRNDFGGKGFNVSRMVAALGGRSVAVGFVGGKTGEKLEAGLNESGIETSFIWLAEETRTNVSIVYPSGYVKVNESGPTVTQRDIEQLFKRVETLARPDDWWVLAGSLPPGAPAGLYAELTAVLKAKQTTVFLDTSGQALALGCQGEPDWCKPNESEVIALTQEPDPVQAARQMRTLGVQNVALTRGGQSSFIVTADACWEGASPQIVEQNPIGAGDSFVGGMVYSLSQGSTVADAFRTGLACGAAAASLPGTQMGSSALIERLRAETAVTVGCE